MSNQDFLVDSTYSGYVFLGAAKGNVTQEDGRKFPYWNMYVLSPVSTYSSEDYEAVGYKAEKKRCVGEVWKDLNPGDHVRLFFDDKQRVVMCALDE